MTLRSQHGHHAAVAEAPPLASPAPALLRPVVFSTTALPATDQFEAWRYQCSDLLDMRETRPAASGYRAEHRVWKLGAMAVSHVIAEEAAFSRTARHIRRDSLDHWIVGVARTGAQTLRTPAGEMRIPARQTHLFSMHRPYEQHRSDVDWLTLIVARDALASLAPALDDAAGRPLEGPMGTLLGAYLEALAGQLPRMSEADLPRAAEATRAMVAACLAPRPDTLAAAREQIECGRLAHLKAMIAQNLRSPTLGPRRLSALAGISRSQLYRLFEPLGGVAAYIQEARLRAAHRALSRPEEARDIIRIAEEFGFYDASTFSRAFRRAFGRTPSEVREAARAGQSAQPLSRSMAGASRFTEILRLL